MFELDGVEHSLQSLQSAAVKYGMDFDSYLETMKGKGLVEKQIDSPTEIPAVESSTDLGSEDGGLESLNITRKDTRSTEEVALKKLKTRFKGLGFTFEGTGLTGDWITVTAPEDKDGNRATEEFSFDKFWGNMFGADKREADRFNSWIKDNHQAEGAVGAIDINTYAKTIKHAENQEHVTRNLLKQDPTVSITDGANKGKKIEDLTAKELEQHQNQMFLEVMEDNTLWEGVVEDITPSLEQYTTEQTILMAKKHDLYSQSGVDEANKELEKLVRAKQEELVNNSPEYKKLVNSVSQAVVSKYGHKDMPGSLLNEKYVLEAEEEILPWTTSAIREIPLIGDAWADMAHGFGVGRMQILKGDIEYRNIIAEGYALKNEGKEISDLKQMLEGGASESDPYRKMSKPSMRENVSTEEYNGTIGDRIKTLQDKIPGRIQTINSGISKSNDYQEKLSRLDPAEIFDESIFNPQVTTDEFQRMLGTQGAQMIGGILMYPTFAQESGGIATESIVIESARKTFPQLYKDVENPTAEEDKKAKEEFQQLSEKARTRIMSKVVENGEVDFGPAVKYGAAAASLDIVSNFFVFAKAAKAVPTSVIRDLIAGRFKKILTSQGAKGLYAATAIESVTESFQEALGIKGVEAATGYMEGGKFWSENNVKRMMEGAGQAFLTTPFLTSGGKVAVAGKKEFNARVFANPKQARALVNKKKKLIDQAMEDGLLTQEERDNEFSELEAVEDMVNNIDQYKSMDLEQKEATINRLVQRKQLEKRKRELEVENDKIKKANTGGVGSVETLQNQKRINDVDTEVAEKNNDILKEVFISNYFQDGKLAEYINIIEEGDFKGKKFKRFENKKEANEYFSKLFENENWLNNSKEILSTIEGFTNKGLNLEDAKTNAFIQHAKHGDAVKLQKMLDMRRLWDGDVNAAMEGNTAWTIDENVIANIRKGDLLSTNAIHHEGLHFIQDNMSIEQLKEMKIAIEKELISTTDPKLLQLAILAQSVFEKRYGNLKESDPKYYKEWMTNLSDVMKAINLKDLNEENTGTLFNVGGIFGDMFKRQTQMTGMDWSKFDAGNALQYIQKWNKFQGVSSGITVRMPRGKVNTEQEDKKSDGEMLASEVYQEINDAFLDYVDVDKDMASNLAADMMQGIVFDRLINLKNANLIQGFETKDLEELQLQFTGNPKDLPKNLKNRGAVGLLKGFDVKFKGGVMGYFNAEIRGRKMLDMRLQEFVENHPKYGNIQVSMQEEGVMQAVEKQETGLSPEEIMIKKEEANELSKTLSQDKTPKTNVLKIGKNKTSDKVIEVTKVKEGDTFKEVQDNNVAAVTEVVFPGVPVKKILDPQANLTYAKKIVDGIPESSEAGNIQDYYAFEPALTSEIKTLPKTNVSTKDADINEIGDTQPVSREVLGKGIGLSNNVLKYFYQPKIKPNGKRARSQGLSSQVKLWELKDKFRNPKIETVRKAQEEFFGITPVGELNLYNRTIGQNLKGFAKHTVHKKSLSAAQRILEAKKADPQQIADITAAQSKTAFSESMKDIDLMHEGAINTQFEGDLKRIDNVLQKFIGEGTFKYSSETEIKNYFKAFEEIVIGNLPENMFGAKPETVYSFLFPSDRILPKKGEKEIVVGERKTTVKDYFNELRVDLRDRVKEGKVKFGKPFKGKGAEYVYGLSYGKLYGNNLKANDPKLPKAIEKSFYDGTREKYNAIHASMHRQFMARVNESIRSNSKNAKIWGNYFSYVGQNAEHPFRMGAEWILFSKNPIGSDKKGNTNKNATGFKFYEWEHAMMATRAYLYLLQTSLEKVDRKYYDFNLAYDQVMENYKLIALDNYDDKVKLGESGRQKTMGENWRFLENWYGDRYWDVPVAEIEGVNGYGINPKSLLGEGRKTAAEIYNINIEGKIPGIKTGINKTTKLNKAITKARTSKFSETSRGITVLDFDDTLATTKSLVKYTTPDGKTGTLNAEEYASTYEDLLGQGYVFDFSEFNKVVKGKIAPLFQKALKLQGKFGPQNMFVLTARPPAAQKAIYDFLKANGLNIPIKNITGLANSTSEAKALWMAEKVGEGYNDFYFADDALQNVQAVDNMLNQFDVKSKVQQARVKFSESMNDNFNDILENVTNIESKKRFSAIKARKRGDSKGKFRFFIPPSHEDFVGLLYNFIGKGKEGNAHRDFFEKALIRPLNRAYRELNAAKQSIANDYKSLNKQFENVKKKLTKKTPDGDFTYQDAIRVYLWDKHGNKIPGISPTDQQKLVDLVMGDPELQAYAETLNVISKQEAYVKPSESWEAGDIRTDLDDATGRVGREQYFAEFQENSDIIFSEENLNKIEAAYGKGVREALEDSLYRTRTGRNRPSGQNKLTNRFLNYLNGSVASTMFVNIRSMLLQQMSIVNFINYGDNNVLMAAKAFANLPQYFADWAMIFNSDFMKQRRGGIKTDVNGAELAASLKGAKNTPRALLGKLLELGFLPTQIGDNFAIATGGAPFYRNRVNTYLKQGLSKTEAESKAFIDFQKLAEETQQSARPDMVSQQQASPLGKIILAFQNVTSQFNRLGKKAFLDIKNRRITPGNPTQLQSDMSNVSRIAYYFAVQNIVFYSLQTALFAMMFDDDADDEKLLKKQERVINGSIDSVLRGTGVMGAVVATLKNMAIKFAEQREKGYNADESAVLMEALNVSPPLGIKARKLVNAEKTLNYNTKVIDEMEMFDIDNPIWSATTNIIEATTNAPLNRMYNKTVNTRNALDNDYTAFQRAMFISGYTTWSLDLGDTKKMTEIKATVKSKKKTKGKRIKIIY